MNVNKLLTIFNVFLWCWLIQDDTAYHLNNHYYLCISPEFPSSMVPSISEGISLWNQFGENRFYLSGDGFCDVLVAPATGKVAESLEHQLDDPYLLGYADLWHHTIYLFMDKVYGKSDVITLAAHEAGHVIGLSHIDMQRFAIMNPYRRYFGFIHPRLFRADVEAYCRLWPCRNVDLNSIDDTVSYGTVTSANDGSID